MYAEAGSRAVYLRRKRAARRRLVWQWSVLAVAVLAVATLLLGLAFAGSPKTLPAGATVGGVDVGGLTVGAAVRRLERQYAALERVPVTFVAGPREFRIRPDDVVLEVDWRSAVDTARRQGDGFAPVRGLRRLGMRFFGADVSPPTRVSDGVLTRRIDRIAKQIDRPERAAAIQLKGLNPIVVPGATGRFVDKDAAARTIVRALVTLHRGPVTVPVRITRPKVTAATLTPVVKQVETAISRRVTLVAGPTRWRLPRWRIAKILDLPDRGASALAIGGPSADAYFARFRRRVDRPARDADFVIGAGDRVTVRPAVPGRRLDLDAARRAILAAALADEDRTARLTVAVAQPERSTREARAMGITGLVGAYTTSYGGDPNRVHNVQLVAQLVDGALIAPGAVFSFNRKTGARTPERGFREAPVIINGELQTGIGGGVCQVSTTVFNAAFEAGLSIEERTNHALYIAHYPQGRDATVNYPDIDLKFKNDTERWLLLRTFVGASELTVKLYGAPVDRRVETETGPLDVVGAPREKRVADPGMWVGEQAVDDYGEPARKTSVTRRVYSATGELMYDTTWTSWYRSEPKIVRYGTKPRPEPEPAPQPPPNPKEKNPQPPPAPPPPPPAAPAGRPTPLPPPQ